MKPYLLLIVAALVAACSTKPVPGVCCIGSDECNRLGLDEDRPCPAGQACVEFQCVVPTCSIQGCPAEAPVCDVTVGVCTDCTDSADCSRFPGTGVCNMQTGSCVECLAQADCTAPTEPICDDGACRGCRLDTECPSGACGDDGACVPEANVVYLHPDGVDAGTCPRAAPCKRMTFGAQKTSAIRNHIVLATGTYDLDNALEYFRASEIPAQQLFIHGGGSVIRSIGDGAVIYTEVSTAIRDLEVFGSNSAITFTATARGMLERVKVHGGMWGVRFYGDVVMRDVTIDNSGTAIMMEDGARLSLNRGLIKNVGAAVAVTGGSWSSIVDISNLLVFGATYVAFDLASSARGTVSFTTIADSGTDSGTGSRAFRCPPSGLTVRSSIIWAPGIVARPAIDGGCTLVSTIVGPTAVPGATNVNPLFVDAAGRDYRLSPGSPARDAVDTGPEIDFEGDPRPRGARFDIGADEAP